MTTTALSIELMQAIADLKQTVADVEARLTNLEAWMGLAQVASTLATAVPAMVQVRVPTVPDMPQVLAMVVQAPFQRRQQQQLEDVEEVVVETKEVSIYV
ncbi:hypothetical protein GUJ93_ZPchr0015g6644 [Zizania palustris]|uniref:Uncharacterized protein n=1 Tax=Zizania palustris TaxID=103762 RepID=A0A8J5TLL2_ZIZPA|nr:hypothetical protein GUJ93_ZPchr0015g6644 [Zizania palustris]